MGAVELAAASHGDPELQRLYVAGGAASYQRKRDLYLDDRSICKHPESNHIAESKEVVVKWPNGSD
jgi:hypothetical protein